MTDDSNFSEDDFSDDEPKYDKLRLDHFLKATALADSGGQAKFAIQNGEVKVNGEVETRRRRQLVVNDVVEIGGQKYVVESL